MNCPTVANAPACFGALQKRRLGRAACVRGQRLEPGHEAGLAAVVGANMANGVRPFGAAARPLIAPRLSFHPPLPCPDHCDVGTAFPSAIPQSVYPVLFRPRLSNKSAMRNPPRSSGSLDRKSV